MIMPISTNKHVVVDEYFIKARLFFMLLFVKINKLIFFQYAKFGATRAWIVSYFFEVWCNWFFCKIGGGAAIADFAKTMLYYPIFKTMKGNNGKVSGWFETVDACLDKILQCAKFIIYYHTQGLEGFGGGV